jgi:hypothetical protein
MSNFLNVPAQRVGQQPPLADWLVALSHDSPLEAPARNLIS